MTSMHGFELLRDEMIPELNSRAKLYQHVKTGAELVSVETDDENKVFGITFGTTPTRSNGAPHIMEHSVLCGSRKYPVKEPFVELLKGSLNTFLNAMTYPDKTTYPVASQNVKDLYNLIDVYLDAVFYPRITPYTLMQEGWHYEVEAPDAPLDYKGVVFNEMKGAYSDPDNVMARYIQQSLFPDNTYGVDSGGDPAEIPNLTFEEFKQFHDTYYHPSNARIWFYGDDDPEERLRFLNEWLKDFERIEVNATVPLQQRYTEPQQFIYPYDAGDQGLDSKKTIYTVNWMLDDISDTEKTLGFSILGHILIGTPASPLRKALIDSGLGEDLAGLGLELDLRQAVFSTGLKGILYADGPKVESLIFDTLDALANGIDSEMIEAAMNTVEFALRENNTGSFPRGLWLMLKSLRTWLHGGDPVAPLAFETPLNMIKAHLAAGEPYFEALIREYLISNPHRSVVVLRPDPEFATQQEAAERERLDQARGAMTGSDIQKVMEETLTLKQMQETSDTPENLATIPSLTLDDLDKQNKTIPIEVSEIEGARVLYHDLFTNGIVYLDLGFNLYGLPQDYLPYISLFGQALLEMGTETEDFVKLSQRIGRKTGGIGSSVLTTSLFQSEQGTAWLFLRGKATTTQAGDLLDILHDILLTVKLDNQERFRQIVLEEKAGIESELVPSGYSFVVSRLRSQFNEAGWVDEQINGVSNLFFLRELAEQIDSDWGSVLETLEAIRHLLINRCHMLANVTLDTANWAEFQPMLAAMLAQLPGEEPQPQPWNRETAAEHEGLVIPSQVNFVGKGADLYKLGYELDGSCIVINNFLNATWLWERVRVHGGAYGGFAQFDMRSGVFTYFSYRDPNLDETLGNYDQTGEFMRELELSQDEVVKSIIGAIGRMDAYQLPDAKGYTSMVRYLTGESNAMRQTIRDEVLQTKLDNFKQFGAILDRLRDQGTVVVLGSQAAINESNTANGEWLKVVPVM
ncbi:MAG TPA: insulinase family protein [Aggregatilineaceae bacterium]|nr:insulinase family protein [Aggregatilineaceae bacterium]